jgi:hypothetical protein
MLVKLKNESGVERLSVGWIREWQPLRPEILLVLGCKRSL